MLLPQFIASLCALLGLLLMGGITDTTAQRFRPNFDFRINKHYAGPHRIDNTDDDFGVRAPQQAEPAVALPAETPPVAVGDAVAVDVVDDDDRDSVLDPEAPVPDAVKFKPPGEDGDDKPTKPPVDDTTSPTTTTTPTPPSVPRNYKCGRYNCHPFFNGPYCQRECVFVGQTPCCLLACSVMPKRKWCRH